MHRHKVVIVRKAKAQLELSVARDIKGNMKCFDRYVVKTED